MSPADLAALLASDSSLMERALRLCEPAPPRPVTNSADALAIFAPLLYGRETEALAVVALDNQCRPIDSAILTTGNSASTIIDPAQILRWVLTRKSPARAFMIAHNHPSGNLTASPEDYLATTRVVNAGTAVGIELLDHLIIVDSGRFTSLREQGVL